MTLIRAARREDDDAVWAILEPVFRAGETYTVARDIGRETALSYWFVASHECFVAEHDGSIVGTYFMTANQGGGGGHVCNCGYVTAAAARGKGIARAMLEHSIERARSRGFLAMQFNFVVSTNERAVKTWLANGFEIVGRLPGAFAHPKLGYVDALVMYRKL